MMTFPEPGGLALVQHLRGSRLDFSLLRIEIPPPVMSDSTQQDPRLIDAGHTNGVLLEVQQERARQDEAWGQQDHGIFVWTSIISEELGEADQAALQATHEGEGSLRDVRDELIQTAATAVGAIEAIERKLAGEAE